MISFYDACALAFNYYKEKLNIVGLAYAAECEDAYIFGGGKKGTVTIGGCVIMIDKETGSIVNLRFPSKENSLLVRNATVLEVPPSYC